MSAKRIVIGATVGYVQFVCTFKGRKSWDISFRDGSSFRVERDGAAWLDSYSDHPLARLGQSFVEAFEQLEHEEFVKWLAMHPEYAESAARLGLA